MNFKSILKKENTMPVIVLTVICLIVALVMGGVNMLTKDKIAENENAKVNESLKVVLDGYYEKYATLPEGTPSTVTSMIKVTDGKGGAELGTIVTVKVKGYADSILMTVGVDVEGKITKVVITSQQETHGQAGMKDYPDVFAGVSSDELSGVDTYSGATISSTAIKNGVIDAMKAVMGNESVTEPEPEEVLPKTDAEIKAIAATLMGVDATALADVTPTERDLVKRIYKSSAGYAVYAITAGGWGGSMDTESVIWIGADGKIKGIEKLTFNTSPASDKYTPPAQTEIDSFFGSLSGVDSSTLGAVDTITNATNTSNTYKGALTEAFAKVEELIRIDEIKSIGATLMGVDASALEDVTPAETTLIKKIFKSSKGYAVYTVTYGGWGGSMDTETVVFIGNDGKIAGIEKIKFITSPASDRYTPPAQEDIDALYDRLVGVASGTLAGVDAVTNATNTTNTLKGALTEALAAVAELIRLDLPTPEDEIKDIAASLMGAEASDLEDVTPANTTLVKRVYKCARGYAVYTVTKGGWGGSMDTETVIYFGMDGKIKGIEKINFITSPASDRYTPPTEAEINALYDRFVGVASGTLSGVDAVTNATNTTNTLKGALTEAFAIVDEMVSADMPTAEDEIKNIAATLMGVASSALQDVTPAKTTLIKKIFKSSNGYAVYTVTYGGWGGSMDTETVVFIGTDGKIKGIEKLTFNTSPASDRYTPPTQAEIDALYDRLVGVGLDTLGAVDAVTNATNTTNTVKGALTEALAAVAELIKQDLPTPESEIKDIAASLMGVNSTDLEDVTPANTTLVKRVYKCARGYAVYTVTKGGWGGSMDTETVIYFGMDGKIKGVEKINFITSPAMNGYNPPSEAEINALYNRLVGASSDTLAGVDAVTNATLTTNSLKGALTEAFAIVDEMVSADMPTAEDEIKNIAATLMGVEASTLEDITPQDVKLVKKVYKSSKGYAVYTVTYNGYGGAMDTETVIWISADGKIAGIEKINFITSPAMNGYNPPSEAEIDALYDRLVGATVGTLAGIDAVSNATNTTNTIKGALAEALDIVNSQTVTPESEIKDMAAALMGVDVSALVNVTPKGFDFVKRVYKCTKGYAVYTVTYNGWGGAMDTETIIWIGIDGSVKGVKKINFITSPAMNGYNPPSEAEIDALYDRLVGATVGTLAGVDAVSNATLTTNSLKGALTEAFSAIEAVIKNYAASLMGVASSDLKDVTPSGLTSVKKIYKSGVGYAVYTVTYNGYGGAMDTETVIWISADGKIAGIEKINFITSPAMNGYNPPSEAEIDALYDRLVGATVVTLSGIDAVSNATNTTNVIKGAITEAFTAVAAAIAAEQAPEAPTSYAPRIIGIIAAALMVLGFAAYIAVPKIIRRRMVK